MIERIEYLRDMINSGNREIERLINDLDNDDQCYIQALIDNLYENLELYQRELIEIDPTY